MTDIARLEHIFFSPHAADPESVQKLVSETLKGMDDGELFLESTQSENLVFDDGVLKTASFNSNSGFGLRSVMGETYAYAHASEISEAAIRRAVETVRSIKSGYAGISTIANAPFGTNRALYTDLNPLAGVSFEKKTAFLAEVDAYVRAREPKVKQVSVSLSGEWQAMEIIRADGAKTGDIRPLVRLNISVVAEHNGRMERAGNGAGGRIAFDHYLDPATWRAQADDVIRQVLLNLESIPAPAGEMPVVLGPGWPGVLLHEAVGHGLEGDFNRKKTSVFSGMMGQRVAAPGVTVVDDGTLPDRRGSISVDDEGVPSQRNVLIEDGILVGYLQDKLNARLIGVSPTGNGRRESFEHAPMPRMTNTFMLAGERAPEDMIKSVDRGLYAVNFGGGQVDITSGKFVFSASEAYLIEGGKVTRPVKGATLIGNGPETMTRITAIGNDLKLDDGIGTCGKAGQGVPVGVGQPTLLISSMTVGGTQVN